MADNFAIPQGSIDYLLNNRDEATRQEFDRRYGKGRSQAVLADQQSSDGSFASRVIGDVGEGITEVPAQVSAGLVRGFAVAPAKLFQRNIGDFQFDAPVTLFNDQGEFDPTWTGFNPQLLSASEFRARDDAGETTGLDELTDVKASSVTGAVVGGASQFVGGLLGLGKFFKVGKGFVGAIGQGAATDFLAFEGDEGNPVDALADMGVDLGVVEEFLGSDKEDLDGVNRLRNSIAGAGIGFASEAVIRVLRGVKGLRSGNKQAIEDVTEGLKDIERAAKDVQADRVVDDPADALAQVADDIVREPRQRSAPYIKLTDSEAADIREATINRMGQSVARRPDINVNLKHVNAQQDVVDLIATQREVLRDGFDTVRGGEVQKWDTVRARANVMGREMARMAGSDPAEFMTRMQRGFDTPTDMAADLHARWNVLMTIEKDVKDLARKVEDGTAGKTGELELLQRMELGSNMLAEVQGLTTNVARALNALKIVRQGDSTLQQIMKQAAGEQLGRDAKAAARAINETRKARKGNKPGASAVGDGNNGIRRSRGLMDDINTFRINALLSGPGTQEVNFVSNAMNLLLIPAEQALGGKPLHAARTYMGMVLGARDAVSTGLKSFWNEDAYLDPFSTKIEIEQMGRLANSKNPLAKVVRLPGRFMMSADEMFKQSAYRGRVYADAVAEASTKGLKGDARKRFIDTYIRQSFDASGQGVRGDALLQAQRSTFTEGSNEWAVHKIMEAAIRYPALRLIIPFIRTPINILSQGFQHLPAIGVISKRFRNDIAEGGPRKAQAIGRQVMGSGLAVMGLTLASAGVITGSGPTDRRLRKIWLQNNKPYSIRWKDEEGNVHFWQYNRLEPLATALAIFADAAEIHELADERTHVELGEVLKAAGMAIAENTVNKTFTQGLFDFMQLLMAEQGSERALNNFAGSFVPNAIPQIQNDPAFREVRGIMDTLRSRIGMDGVDPRRDILGNIAFRPGAKWDPMGLFVGDVRKDDPVMNEIERLGRRFGSSFDIPRSYRIENQDIREIPFEGNPEQSLYDRRLELSGTVKIGGMTLRDRLSRLVRSKRYARMRDGSSTDNKGPKYKEISRTIRKYREAADRQLRRESEAYKSILTGLRTSRRDVRKKKTLEEIINE